MTSIQGQIFRASGSAISIQASDAKSGSKTPRFTMTAYTGQPIRQLFAENPIVVDLEGMTIPDRAIPIRLGHDSEEGVGHADIVQVEYHDGLAQLVAEGVVSRVTNAARDVVESGRNGFPWQASISASIESVEGVSAGETVTVNGRSIDGPITIARRTTLGEISFVDLGADDNTAAQIAASSKANGPEGKDMGDTQKAGSDSTTIEAGDTTTTTTKATPEPIVAGAIGDLRERAERAKVDAERQAKIKASATSAMDARADQAEKILELAEQAIADRIDASDFSLQMLRFSQDFPGVGSPRVDQGTTDAMIEAGLLIEIGQSEDQIVASYGEQVVEAARRKFGGGLGLNEAVSIAAQAAGCSMSRIKASNISQAVHATFGGQMIQAASTVSLPNILSNVANKVAISAFNAVDSSWQSIASVASLNDFKQHTTNALVGDFKLKQIGSSGDIEHAVPGEETYTAQIDTFARMLDITRRDIINDNTGALLQAPSKLGRGAILSFNDTFWTEFENNGSFFTAGNNNLETGAGSALDVTSLTTATVALMNQTDPDGENLGLTMSDLILLVPPALAHTARQLANSSEIRNPGASDAFGVANPHQGNYTVVVSPYLTSATAWYVLAKPSVLPVIQAGFLNGRRTPTIESAQADFNNLGIRMRGYWDFGASKWEYRAGVKSNGA